MDRIMDIMKEHLVDIHVTLPRPLAEALTRVARARKTRRAHLLRRAVEDFLAREREAALDEELRQYVERQAARSDEFVRETGAHVGERLLRETRW